MTIFAIAIMLTAAAASALFVFGRIAHHQVRAAKANGLYALDYVWVEDDGSVREITPKEAAYLNTEFAPGDGARPYIKPNYSARTPTGQIGGFLARGKVPKDLILLPTLSGRVASNHSVERS